MKLHPANLATIWTRVGTRFLPFADAASDPAAAQKLADATETARRLGMHRRTLQRKLQKRPTRFRTGD